MESTGTTKKTSTSLFFKGLGFIQKNLIIFIPLAMALGIIYGQLFESSGLKNWVLPATFFMVYPMMITLNINKLFAKGGTKLFTSTHLLNFVVIPLLGYALGFVFFKNNIPLRIGMLLIALIPTSGMTVTWTGIAKGNINEAIRITVSGLLLGAVLTPIYLKTLLGTVVEIPMLKIFTQIALVVFVPLVFGYATQRIFVKKVGQEKFQKQIKPKVAPISTLGVLFMVFIAMALKSKDIVSNPQIILSLILPLVIFYLSIFIVSTLVAKKWFNKADGIAMVYGTSMRNLVIALAVAMMVFNEGGTAIAIVIAVAFTVQVQMAVWYLKISKRIFPEASLQDKAENNFSKLYSSEDKEILKVAEDSLNPKLDRIQEIISYCKEADIKHVGIANCVAFEKETIRLQEQLHKEDIKTESVNCKLGKVQFNDLLPGYKGVSCNPAGQANHLNEKQTQLNLMVGLCLGHDMIFNKKSEAPVTPLVVKDRKNKHHTIDLLKEAL